MPTPFRFFALPIEPFRPWFEMSDEALRARGARRVVADSKPGYPCRVSLVDADPGERLILLPYTHHDVDSPYRASGPIYVRECAVTATPAVGELPAVVAARLLSIRAYDGAATLVASEVVEGTAIAGQVQRLFHDPAVAYLHVHNARPGCYSCRVERA